jgi:hypothetical protein
MSQHVFFTHANGFPSATYGKLFDALAPEYAVAHLSQHGHDPRFRWTTIGRTWSTN